MGQHAKGGPSRRDFLVGGAGAALGLGFAFRGRLDFVFGGNAEAAAPLRLGSGGGGTVAAKNRAGLMADPSGRLSLPPGFTYTVVAESGTSRLESGEATPSFADGMGAFATPGGGIVLVTNHEIAPGASAVGVPALPALTYDPGCPGGTTNVLLDSAGNRLGEHVSLAGTDHNCAGGVTPWGTWLSCEESEASAGEGGRRLDHGYVFEVDPLDRTANLYPQPIKALGRFRHEAAVVDPDTGQIYLTEDAGNPNGLLYRWTPPRGFVPGKGALRRLGPTDGALEVMRARVPADDRVVADLSVARRPGTDLSIEWVTVPERDARVVPTRRQLLFDPDDIRSDGADVSRARKLEGAWWADGGLYFVSSYAKPSIDGSARAHGGQVWYLHPGSQTITLVLWYAPREDSDSIADGPDNITISPFGGVLIAEDGDGGQHLLGATPMGETFYVARNEVVLPNGGSSEFTGPVFSADRRILFANLQVPGTTFAITGDWDALAAEHGWKSFK